MASIVFPFGSMARDDRPVQTRPTGAPETIDEKWKKTVLARMAELGMTRAALAREVKVTASAITVLFQPQTSSTRIKGAVHKALGLMTVEPTPAVVKEDKLRRIMRNWGDLSEEQRDLVAHTVEMLLAKNT